MQKKFNDDTFLARWLDGTLTKEEVSEFEKSEDFAVYGKISETSKLLKSPYFNKEKSFNQLLETKRNQKKKFKLAGWSYWLAASIAIIVGIYTLMPSEISYTSNAGEQLTVNLPDGSEVKLNSVSALTLNKKEWKKSRTLDLEGEAYFNVRKGSTFTVRTQLGNVRVLGTEFTVHSRDKLFEIRCYEGKVKVVVGTNDLNLTRGKGIRIVNDELEHREFNDVAPGWINGEMSFKNIPLKEVINSIERQFDVKINTGTVDLEQRFTGSFTNDNLDVALRVICYAMEIEFTIESKDDIKLIKK